MIDEYDELLKDVKHQGDPLGLIEARGHTYSDFVAGICSTPSRGNVETYLDECSGLEFWAVAPPEDLESPIWSLWQSGTMFHWAWPCLHCRQYFVPRFSCLKWDEPVGAKPTPSQARKTAYVQCPRCGGIHDDDRDHKREMNRRGRYVAPGQTIDADGVVTGEPPATSTASFWVSGLASPFVSWGARAEQHLQNVRLADIDRIRTSINASFGECHAPGVGEPVELGEILAHRADYKRGDLPDGVLALVMTVDVQRESLIVLIRGWGARATSWLIDWGELHGDTSSPQVWHDLIDLMSTPLHGLPLRLVLIDSGFRPGKADEVPLNRVYDFARRFPRSVRCTKGSSWPMRTPIARSKIEVDRKGGIAKRGLSLLVLDSDHWKSWVHERLRWPMNEPGSWYLPSDVDHDYCKQILSESRERSPSGRIRWVQRAKQNHYLDTEAMQAAAGHLLNAARIRERPQQQQQPAPDDDHADEPPQIMGGDEAPRQQQRPYQNWLRPRREEERW
jgi:phage terminase large subunit GpA-like protein